MYFGTFRGAQAPEEYMEALPLKYSTFFCSDSASMRITGAGCKWKNIAQEFDIVMTGFVCSMYDT